MSEYLVSAHGVRDNNSLFRVPDGIEICFYCSEGGTLSNNITIPHIPTSDPGTGKSRFP